MLIIERPQAEKRSLEHEGLAADLVLALDKGALDVADPGVAVELGELGWRNESAR
jgi:hypothetical protein